MSSSSSLTRRWRSADRTIPSAAVLSPSVIRFRAHAAQSPLPQEGRDRARRLLNIAVSLLGIVLSAPLMLLIGALVKFTSPGPAIYKQPRVGIDRRAACGRQSPDHRRRADRGGRIFTIYKFRTMRPEAGPARQVWASKADSRITPIGRVLRQFRLDELPQLFNVLKGDMNIVGPRPEQPEIFRSLQDEFGHYRDRQRVLPGITGLAQVTLPYDRNVADVGRKVDLDLEYIRRRSAAQDLLIMAKTMPVMVFRKGSI
ncbi:MAG TPA: sugar transferase [Longimicrobiales bacterium]|nr:sugar transferase [Longimicrobiales bacterium]